MTEFQRFLTQFTQDPAFRRRIEQTDSPEEKLRVAEAAGFKLSLEDVREHSGHLNDDVLSGLTGAGESLWNLNRSYVQQELNHVSAPPGDSD